MTVDMLAATFFWPEGTLFGAPPSHTDLADPDVVSDGDPVAADRSADADGFWSIVIRHLWRPLAGTPPIAAP